MSTAASGSVSEAPAVTPGAPAREAPSLGSLGEIISDISADLSTLVRQELDLAKAEVTESATRAGKGAGLLGGAGVAAHMVLIFLSVTAWFALDNLLHSLAWSALIVTAVWAVIAVVLALMGRRQLSTINGIPRTVETAKKVPGALKGNENPLMSNPDEIRAEIARTRSDLSTNVNALGEAVNPGNVARRQVDKVTSKAGDLKERVMGSAHDAVQAGSDTSTGLKDQAAAVPGQVKGRTRGNPLAMGLIALGAGWLVGSLMPATDQEAQLAATVKEQAQPLLEQAQTAAQESMQNLKEPAQDAAQSVASRAQEAAENVKAQGQEAAGDVKDTAETARQNVTNG